MPSITPEHWVLRLHAVHHAGDLEANAAGNARALGITYDVAPLEVNVVVHHAGTLEVNVAVHHTGALMVNVAVHHAGALT